MAVEAGRHFVFSNAGTPDGRYLIGSLLRDQFLDTTSKVPGDAVLYDVATARIVEMAPMQAPNSQVQSASADDDWVVWQEADDATGFDWHLFAYSRSTGHVKEIARAAIYDGRPVPSPLSFVWVSHGTAVWGQAVGSGVQQGDVANAVVRRADLASGKITTVATAAGAPALSWPWMALEVFPKDGHWHVVFRNLETGWAGSMDSLPPVISLAGQSASFGATDSHSIWLMDDITKPGTAVQIARGADEADYLEWPTLNSRIVAWSQNNQSIVFDRAENRLVTLPVTTGWASSTVAGPNLVWAEDGPTSADTEHPDWIVVVDTSQLPIQP